MNQSLTVTTPSQAVMTEKLDSLRRGGSRLAERDRAVASQYGLLVKHHHLAISADAEVSAVHAVVRQHEALLATFDLAVRTRGHAVVDDEARGGVAPQLHRIEPGREHRHA